jgi:AraC-like DNA-binding protein
MQAPAPDFSRRRLKIDEQSSRKEKEWFHDVYRRSVVKIDIAPYADAPFIFDTTIRALSDVVVSRTLMSPMLSQRQKQTDTDALMIAVPLAGSATILRDGQEALLPAGAATYSRYDAADASGALDIRANTLVLALRLSRRLIEPLVAGYENLTRQVLPGQTEAVRLLVDYLDMLEARESIATVEAQRLVVNHVHDLAALVVGASRDGAEFASGRGGRAARLAAVKKDILNNLEQGRLSVAAVAARQGVSVRYVHMLFEMEGMTFSEYVVGHRLARAHRMLNDPRHSKHTISAIALMVGFGDLSYFNRTFRRRFGMSPSDVRAAVRGGS